MRGDQAARNGLQDGSKESILTKEGFLKRPPMSLGMAWRAGGALGRGLL